MMSYTADFVSSPWSIVLLALSIVACAIIKWYRNPYRRIPGPRGLPFLGNTLDFSGSSDHHTLLLKWAQDYGPIFKYYVLFGGYRIHITDPDIAKHVIVTNCINYRRQDVLKEMLPGFGNGLITTNGRTHAVQRKQLNPFFSIGRVQRFLPLFIDKANQLVQFWTSEISASKEQTIDCDVLEKLTHMTLDVIGLSAFGYSFNCILGGHTEESKATDTILRASFDLQRRSLEKFFPLLKLIPSKNRKNIQEAEQCFRNLIYKIIKARKSEHANGQLANREDLLTMLFDMIDENQNKLTERDLYHQIFTFLIAGHETTSLTTCWTLYLLAKHPELQQKLRDEINDACSDREVSWKDLDKIKLLNNCIKESMRLYPVAITTDRTAINADKLGPYRIPAGTHVMIGIGSLHRLATYWKDPDEFDPHRFDREDESSSRSSQYHFLPFSRGPRMCIGYRFALTEMKVLLAKLLRTFEFNISKEHDYDIKSTSSLTLKPFPAPILRINFVEKS